MKINPIIAHHLDCLGVDCEWRAEEVRAYIESIIAAIDRVSPARNDGTSFACTYYAIDGPCGTTPGAACEDCENTRNLLKAIEGKEFARRD